MRLIDRLIANEIRSTLALARYGYLPKRYNDSTRYTYLSKRQARRIRRLADRAIRIHDRKYNDIIGIVAFQAGMALLIPLLKAALASTVADNIKQSVFNPLIQRIFDRFKMIKESKGDGTYTEAIVNEIKSDMEKLLAALKKEGSYLFSKIQSLWQKIRGIK